MIDPINPRSRSDAYGSKINRDHSRIRAYTVPWLSVLVASILPALFVATAIPLIPPLGFMLFVTWRLVRPGLLPMWAGIPLGLFDDLFSGQPLGFGIFAWSLTMLAIEAIETRFPWRGFFQDWLTAGVIFVIYILAGAILSGGRFDGVTLYALAPQLVISVLAFPICARLIALLDRARLKRVRVG